MIPAVISPSRIFASHEERNFTTVLWVKVHKDVDFWNDYIGYIKLSTSGRC